MAMDRRTFTKSIASFLTSAAGLSLFHTQLYARQYLTVEQAKTILWGNEKLEPQVVKLTLAQRKRSEKGLKSESDVPNYKHGKVKVVVGSY